MRWKHVVAATHHRRVHDYYIQISSSRDKEVYKYLDGRIFGQDGKITLDFCEKVTRPCCKGGIFVRKHKIISVNLHFGSLSLFR